MWEFKIYSQCLSSSLSKFSALKNLIGLGIVFSSLNKNSTLSSNYYTNLDLLSDLENDLKSLIKLGFLFPLKIPCLISSIENFMSYNWYWNIPKSGLL